MISRMHSQLAVASPAILPSANSNTRVRLQDRSCSQASGQHVLGYPERHCRTFNAGQQLIPYETAWAWQKLLVAEAQRAARAGSRDIADAILLLQHPSVYTLGAGSTEDNLRFDPSHPPFPLYRTERGGEVTYHGPGQLVLYPIMNLRRHQPDLHWYLRQLEEVVIRALDSVSGLHGERIDGLTGVWVEGKKVAAIGVRARQWITYHGVALNVAPDLGPFKQIVPCGIADREVTSVEALLQLQQALDHGQHVEASEQLLQEYEYALLEAFSELFDVQLVHADLRQLTLPKAFKGP